MDNSTLQQKVYGFSLIIASVLLVISTFFWQGGEVGITGGTIQVFSCIFWLPGLFGLLSLLRPAMPRLAAWMSIAATIACIGGNNWGMDGLFFQVYRELGASATHETVYATMGPAAILTLQFPGLFFPLTLIVTGIALFRSKRVPAWCGLCLAIGGLAFPISRIPRIETLAHLADLLLFIPALVLGLRMMGSMRDESEKRVVVA